MAPAGYWLQVEMVGEQVWVLSPSVGTHPWVGRGWDVPGDADLSPGKAQSLDLSWQG